MKKLTVIVLALLLVVAFAGCNTSDSANKIRRDYDNYNWQTANYQTQSSEASKLIARINKLPASEQASLTSVKASLQKRSRTNTRQNAMNPYPINNNAKGFGYDGYGVNNQGMNGYDGMGNYVGTPNSDVLNTDGNYPKSASNYPQVSANPSATPKTGITTLPYTTTTKPVRTTDTRIVMPKAMPNYNK